MGWGIAYSQKTFGGDDITNDADNVLNTIAIVILSLFCAEVALRLLALQELVSQCSYPCFAIVMINGDVNYDVMVM